MIPKMCRYDDPKMCGYDVRWSLKCPGTMIPKMRGYDDPNKVRVRWSLRPKSSVVVPVVDPRDRTHHIIQHRPWTYSSQLSIINYPSHQFSWCLSLLCFSPITTEVEEKKMRENILRLYLGDSIMNSTGKFLNEAQQGFRSFCESWMMSKIQRQHTAIRDNLCDEFTWNATIKLLQYLSLCGARSVRMKIFRILS
jgi:hypothetical protein